MKNFLQLSITGCLAVFSAFNYLQAQCNVNDKYDKIISGYHSSIALKDNGVYAVWGSYMKNSGSNDQLAPQDISVGNYPTLTGTVLKAALGGKTAGAQMDQAIILTTNGLWAWGVAGNVLSSSVKSGNTFGRTSTSAVNGFNTYGLPSTLTPMDVASLFATYQTLVLLTTTGNVWVLTQASLAVEGNGGVVGTAGTSKWVQVKKDASTFLTNVTAVRGECGGTNYNAFMALTTSGEVYTWGNTTYLGNGSIPAARNFATLMSLPTEFSTSIPKMIGITGGVGTTATTKNTYFLLSNAGNLYSLGDNSQRQCGDFTIVDKLSWVNVKKSAALNDNLTNINFFSCQEHNSSYPATAAITKTGVLYTWGNNSSGMVGRTDNGLPAGGLSTISFDPGIPVGFTGTAVSVEMGGHTMVYLKEGSAQFCYVGHYTNGSMGDGTSNNNGTGSATSLKHDCTSTPSISICGSVPVAASTINSTITASPTSIAADGSSTSTITIQLKNAAGVNLTASGGVITLTTTSGSLGTVTDNNNGTYTVTLTSSASPGSTTLSFSINGTLASNSSSVNFVTILPLSWENVVAYRKSKTVKISWTTSAEQNTANFDIERSINGSDWSVIIAAIPAVNAAGANTYNATDTSYNPNKLYYRVRQRDLDGRRTLSAVVTVPPISQGSKIIAYPVPAVNSFRLANVNAGQLKKIELVSMNGTPVRAWNQYLESYAIQGVPPGNYILRIETREDVQVLKLVKQ